MKIKEDFIKNQYKSGVENYSRFTKEVGLWSSEKYVFEKYLNPNDEILDLGCGTGRTTFPLFKLGFVHITGIDLTPEMIEKAIELNSVFKTKIEFIVGDATKLDYKDSSFDSIIFSFNGLMSIPNQQNRDKAILEINRLLQKSGIFIFTTHDRDKEPDFFEFWKEEKERWLNNVQDQRLYNFGDLITNSKNEERNIYIHIPNKEEIATWLELNGFDILETFYRSDKFEESQMVKEKSGECRFWICKKK